MIFKHKQAGAASLRSRIESTFGSLLFVSTALFYAGGTIAMFLQAPALAA